MKLLATLSLMTLALIPTSAPAATVEVKKSVPTLLISGVIAEGNIIPIGIEMLDLATKGKREVQLIINSPGGSVTTGFSFLSLMDAARAKGLKVTCFVPQIAASMAYQILLHCDERHTLNTAFLLWHRARVVIGGGLFSQGEALTGPEAMKIGRDLTSTDNAIFSEILRAMGKDMKAEELAYHFEAETLHVGMNLHAAAPNFITSHSAIPNLFETAMELLKTKKASMDAEGSSNIYTFPDREIIYISTRKFPVTE